MKLYKGADKSLARPGRKQANVSIRMAWISFGALPCRKTNLMTARVSILLKMRESLTCFWDFFHPRRAKDLPEPWYRGTRGIAPRILKLCSFTPLSLYIQQRTPVPKELEDDTNQEANLAVLGFEIWTFQLVASRYSDCCIHYTDCCIVGVFVRWQVNL